MPTRRNGWSECSRYVAYEPGRVDRRWMKERQEGRITFEAKALAAEISRRYPDLLEGRDDDWIEFHRWLLRADEFDERITRLPEGEKGWGLMMGDMVMRGEARIYCRLCRGMVEPSTLREEEGCRELPYQFNTLRCGAGHLLLRTFLIHLCLAPPPGFREALRKLREEREAASSIEALLGVGGDVG